VNVFGPVSCPDVRYAINYIEIMDLVDCIIDAVGETVLELVVHCH
jgi:hypothetical protein